MESNADKLRAWILAALVHLLVAALLFAGLFWTASTARPTIAGPVIEAELVGLTAAPKPRAAPRPKPPPEPPKPQEQKPEPPTPPAPTRNDQVDREKVAEMAREKAEQEKQARDEKVRQEQIRLDQQHQKELEEIKRQLAAAEKKVKLERDKMQQLKDLQTKKPAPVTPPVPEAEQARTGAAGTDTSLEAEYFAAIQNAVIQNWLRPDNTQPGLRCMLRIVQIPGGDLIGVQIGSPCNADPATRNSIEQAVRRAAPLPYKGFEKVFVRDLNFNFTYDG